MEQPIVSVIVVNWNTATLLRDCLAALTKDEGPKTKDRTTSSLILGPSSVEIVVIDNASTDGSADVVHAEFPEVRLIVNGANVGFARANNQGIGVSHGRYVVLLNSDTVASAAALDTLVAFMDAHPEAGAVGPRLLRPDGTVQPYAFGGDPTLGYLLRRGFNRLLRHRYLHDWDTNAIQEVDWVSGACLMARRSAIEQAGPLDESMFMYFEDNEWCLRIRKAGCKVYYDPQASIVHLGGQSVAQNPAARQAYTRSLRTFYRKHYGTLASAVMGVLLSLYQWVIGR
jgi:N-acetylglucosaminyl-diphospho-decaprenol L-rhamnosyltransferase